MKKIFTFVVMMVFQRALAEEVMSSPEIIKVQQSYQQKIKEMFNQKCLDCHSDQTHYPWYYHIPGLNKIMDKHIRQGRRHWDMGTGFPFIGKKSQLKYLHDIEEVIEDNSMPPWYYLITHPSAKVSDEEKKVILDWVHESENLLKNSNSVPATKM